MFDKFIAFFKEALCDRLIIFF